MRGNYWQDFHQFDILAFQDDTMRENQFRARVQQDGFFALYYDDEMIGQLIITPFGDDEGHLGRVAVAPKHQGKGYGTIIVSKALEWFKKRSIRTVHLYTQHDNHIAQSLYRKFGFETTGIAWQYYVPIHHIKSREKFTCDQIKEEDIDFVGTKYPSMPTAEIRRFLRKPGQHVFTLKDKNKDIVGACRFTPSFPGCFPFEIDMVESFDDFMHGLQSYMLPQFNYIRITQTNNHELANLCERRGYRLHHKLFKMTLNIS